MPQDLLPDLPNAQQQQPQDLLPDVQDKSMLQSASNIAQSFNTLVEQGLIHPTLGLTRGLEQSLLNTGYGMVGKTAPNITQGNMLSEKIGQALGSIGQFVAAPEAAGLQKLSLLPRMLTGGGLFAALGAAQARGSGVTGEDLAKETILSGGLGALGEGTAKGLEELAQMYPRGLRETAKRPGSILASPEEAKGFLDELEKRGIDLDIDVGTLSQDPAAIERYNKFWGRYVPGMKKGLAKRTEAYNTLFEDMYRSLQKGRTAQEARQEFGRGLERHYDRASQINNQNYKALAEAADNARVYINKFDNVNQLAQQFEGVKVSKPTRYLLKRLQSGGSVNPATGERSGLSFKELDQKIKNLNQKIRWNIGTDAENQFKKALSSAMKNDLEAGVDAAGNQDLNQLRQNASNFYKENLAVLKEEPALYRIAKANSDDIADFDKVLQKRDMAKIIRNLDDDSKGAGLFYLFSKSAKKDVPQGTKSFKEINPNKLLALHKNMPLELREVFYGPEGDAAMKFYEHMATINADSAAELKSIRTGEQTAKAIADLTKLGAVEKIAEGGTGALKAMTGMTAGRGIAKYLTSEPVLQTFLTGKGAFKTPKRVARSGAATLKEILGN